MIDNRDIRRNGFLRSFVLLVCLCMSLLVNAQNNPYKINDKLYGLYARAYSLRRSPSSLPVADSLYNKAVAIGDKKAQCLALTIPFLYNYYNGKTLADLEPSLKRLQDKALQTGYLQYYYYGSSNKVIFLLNREKNVDAMEYIEKQLEYAKKNNHLYGLYTGYRMLAFVHQSRGEYMQAIENFKQAAEYIKKYFPEQEISNCYRPIAECYKFLDNLDKTLEYSNMGLKVAKSHLSKAYLLYLKAYAEYGLGNDADFKKTYSELREKYKDLSIPDVLVMSSIVEVFNDLLNGKPVDIIDKMPEQVSYEERCLMKCVYYRRNGKYLEAMEWQQKLYWFRNERNQQTFNKDLLDMNMRYNTQKLLYDKQKTDYANTQLELANTQLTLQNSSLELGRVKTAEYLARMTSDKNLLYYNNQKLVSRQLRDSLKTQQVMRREREKRERLHSMMTASLIVIIFVILLLSSVYVFFSRRMSKKLKASNRRLNNTVDELNVAKDKAQQADKMKTMFIQNMSHEIRTPLNSIVGFSQLLVEMGDEFDEEEKKSMAKSIIDNSDLLSTLVNDILDITSLESGRYVMKMGSVNVNELCNSAISTVMHRKAQGVDLLMSSLIPDDYCIVTDEQRVKQVIINMLTNAEKNTEKGKIVLGVSLDEEPGMITFSVADTGIGVPREKIKEIFERFRKLDMYKQGSGLGLNICRMIAERLGGFIDIDPSYTGGARFVFSIPVKRDMES